MAETKKPTKAVNHQEPHTLFEASRRILLAAIGTISLAQEEAEEFIDRLVEKGEIAEKDGRELMKELIEKRKTHRREIAVDINHRLKETLAHMNMPTRDDIDGLSKRIAELTKMVEELKKNRE